MELLTLNFMALILLCYNPVVDIDLVLEIMDDHNHLFYSRRPSPKNYPF